MKTKSHREQVEITGNVFQMDTERRTFKVKTDDGLRVTAPYTDNTRHMVIEALKRTGEQLVKVSGTGEFGSDGTLKRVVKSERIIYAIAPREIDPNAPSITEMFDALIASYPEEFWEEMPTNLVERHLAHRHGECSQGE